MRSVLTALVLVLLSAAPAISEQFLGRTVAISDGRSDTSVAAPVIIAMHGFLGTSRNMQRKTSFDQLARRNGFVVVYPNGEGRRWNDGRSPDNPVDDVGYLSALIGSLVSDGLADPQRVYLTGHSNGGGMAMRMACDRPDLIAAISVVATKLPTAYTCANGAAVPAILFHGTEDPIAPHTGRPEGSRLGATLSAQDSLAVWERRNRCSGAVTTQEIDRANDGTEAHISQYAPCTAPLTYVLIHGHGHDWPGVGQRSTRLQGPATREVDAAQLSWWFFSAL
ncbi:prolyl oligopeptidase family serine peptidase [Octadecabacter sp. CECT 8868]|uniref:alpha/beta hydrolase family esterase n=1 Tax=Octadecabacter algicola TaxID=2909342 RepID=UPI001F283D12|nr:alpha/beta fold hydrolase [Octadecabacter algicola]MCF2904845.1 prolyl oligopeptidase family serine peptidase [Octadecabacter algicola]